VGWNGYQMKMIGHKAVTPDGQSVLKRVGSQQIQEHDAVIVGVEYIGSSIAALGDVVRQPRHDNPLAPRHGFEVVVW
jgi:hypothetical protein